MGILNVTPDSFSGDGIPRPRGDAVECRALEQARRFVEAGALLLDVGGEFDAARLRSPSTWTKSAAASSRSSRPWSREFPDSLISIDTYKAVIAQEALDAGAHIVNDVWALRADPELRDVVARAKCPVILMHNRSNPASVEVRAPAGQRLHRRGVRGRDRRREAELLDSVAIARAAGIPDERIILDPGIGFGKKVEHNLELINRLDEIRALGFPVLLGPSRKSFIGYTLDLPADQRLEGTAATVAVGIVRGADIVRVHDVEPLMRVVKMTDALVRTQVDG